MRQTIFDMGGVSYSYFEDNFVLKDINMKIESGERVVILGANGSGKSTLLKLLNGLIFANSGKIKAFDQDINEDILERGDFAIDFRKQVAFVFQDSDIQLFSATVYDDLTFGPLQLGQSKEDADQKANDLLKMLNLEKLKNRSPNNLSGGEKKKVAIATSLSTNPDVLLLDEPTNNLDPKTRTWFYKLLEELADSGKTIILSTQDLELAEVFAKRAIVLNEEHAIVADDNADVVLENKELLLSVNLIHEHVHCHNDKSHVHTHYHATDHDHEHKK